MAASVMVRPSTTSLAVRVAFSFLSCILLALTLVSCDLVGSEPPDDPNGIWQGTISTEIDTTAEINGFEYSFKGEVQQTYSFVVERDDESYLSEVMANQDGWFVETNHGSSKDTLTIDSSSQSFIRTRYNKPFLIVNGVGGPPGGFPFYNIRLDLANNPAAEVGFSEPSSSCNAASQPCPKRAFGVLLLEQEDKPLNLSR